MTYYVSVVFLVEAVLVGGSQNSSSTGFPPLSYIHMGMLAPPRSLRRPTHEVVILSIISTRPRCTAGWLASDASAAFTAHPFTQAPAAPPPENGERQRQKHLKQPW